MNKRRFVLLVVFFSFFLSLVSAFNFETNDISITTTTITGNLTRFTDLIDTPADYTGDGGNCVKVNVGETGLTFSACAGGGDFSFSDFAAAFNSNASVYIFST